MLIVLAPIEAAKSAAPKCKLSILLLELAILFTFTKPCALSITNSKPTFFLILFFFLFD